MIEPLLMSIIIGFVWYLVISHFGASILLHRYYCHKQFEVPVWFEIVGLAMLMIAVVRSPIGWISAHRIHHHHSDGPKDPHSPNHVGFWKVLFHIWDIPNIAPKYAKDLFLNPRLIFCHKHWIKLWIGIWVISFLISPYFFIAFALMPFILAKIGFGLLNTVGHKTKGGVNVPWLNILVAGEGYHREHHKDSSQVRLHKYDTSGYISEKLFVKR